MAAASAPEPWTRSDGGPARIVFVTQVLDPDDSVLGFVVDWVKALVRRSECVVVVANEVRRVPRDLGAEVISLGKERGARRSSRFVRYQRVLRDLARTMHPDAILAHMCPVYLNAAAPIAVRYGIKKVLWFAHPAVHRQLLLAERAADVILTSFPGAYPRDVQHVLPIGQAIDIDAFQPTPLPYRETNWRALVLGRTSASKRIPTIIEGVEKARRAGIDLHLCIVGSATTPLETDHRRELEGMVERRREFVELHQGVSRQLLPALLQQSDILINGMVRGSGDKVVLEAMAAGRPVIVSNPVFASLLADMPANLMFRDNDAADLADQLIQLLSTDVPVLESIGHELRKRVEDAHSLDHWAREVVRLCAN